MNINSPRVLIALAGACAGLLSSALPAQAGVRPAPCVAPLFEDGTDDVTNLLEPADDPRLPVPFGFNPPSLDLTGGYLSRGADGSTTFNIMVRDLSTAVPLAHMTISWTGYFVTPDGGQRFVRAAADVTGAVLYEYGTYKPANDTQPIGLSQVEGTTTGELFLGPNGLVSIKVPAALATPDSTLTAIYAQSGESRGLPLAAPGYPSRGLSSIMDSAPDEAAESTVEYTVAPCVES